MLVKSKSRKEFIYKIIFYIIGCGALYIYGINLITFIILGFFIIQIILNIVNMSNCKQTAEYKIDIKDDVLYFDTQKFPLAKSYLFFNLADCGKKISVSLYQEKDTKVATIFQSVIFNQTEFIEFFKLIRPYRKFRAFPWNKFNTNNTLYICRDGFIICGRELFYSEVKKVDWKTKAYYNMTAKMEVVTIYIDLKNGGKIIEYFKNARESLYAKLIYLDMRINNKKITKATGYKKFTRSFNKILEELDKKECEE